MHTCRDGFRRALMRGMVRAMTARRLAQKGAITMTIGNTAKTVSTLVAEAKTRVENLTPAQAAEELARGGALLVDLRESEERAQHGVIPAAVHAPRGMLEFYADPQSPYHRPEFDPSRRVILHCASGGRSALAAETLRTLGYGNVAHVDGGFKLWKEQGLPVAAPESAAVK